MNGKRLLIGGAVLLLTVQAAASYLFHRDPILPTPPPLAQIPFSMGEWTEITEQTIPPEALKMLGPDDFVARVYQGTSDSQQAELFVAYYKTQLRAQNAHDPKVCLPGAGWNPVASHVDRLSPSPGISFPVNYYRIRKVDTEQVVLYWFQTFKGVYAQEQQLQAHRVWDAVFDNRTDMALVRVVVPVTGAGVRVADANASRLAKVVYQQMLSYFPATAQAGS